MNSMEAANLHVIREFTFTTGTCMHVYFHYFHTLLQYHLCILIVYLKVLPEITFQQDLEDSKKDEIIIQKFLLPHRRNGAVIHTR